MNPTALYVWVIVNNFEQLTEVYERQIPPNYKTLWIFNNLLRMLSLRRTQICFILWRTSEGANFVENFLTGREISRKVPLIYSQLFQQFVIHTSSFDLWILVQDR